jgi:hypothetical protein
MSQSTTLSKVGNSYTAASQKEANNIVKFQRVDQYTDKDSLSSLDLTPSNFYSEKGGKIVYEYLLNSPSFERSLSKNLINALLSDVAGIVGQRPEEVNLNNVLEFVDSFKG